MKTPNAQRPTPKCSEAEFRYLDVGRSALGIRRFSPSSERLTYMDSDQPPTLRSLITRTVCTLLAVPLLYMLSIGPAFIVAWKFPRSRPALATFYIPFHWAIDGTPLEAAIPPYATWWLKLFGGPPTAF